jgi:hypothetical protein
MNKIFRKLPGACQAYLYPVLIINLYNLKNGKALENTNQRQA